METVLDDVCLERADQAHQTRAWKRWESNKGKKSDYPPLSDLIEVVDELKLLRTSEINSKVDKIQIDYIFTGSPFGNEDPLKQSLLGQLSEVKDAKKNYENMHTLRNLRNAIHPMKLIEDNQIQLVSDSFVALLFRGLRLLLLLEQLLGIEPKLSSSTP